MALGVPLASIALALAGAPHLETTPDGAGTERELLLFFEERDLVTATKRTASQRRAPAISTVIGAAEIRDMGARSLLDVLRVVPGLGLSISENGTNLVEVRGIRTAVNEKILVMVDGHPLNRSGFGSALYNYADTMLVEKIQQVEVVRGPGSALYGSGAFVATINVITRDPADVGRGEVTAGGGSFGTATGNALLAGRRDEVSALASLGGQLTDGPRLRVEADALRGTPYTLAPGAPHLDYQQTDAFAKVLAGDLSVRGQYLHKRRGANVGLGYALTDEDYNDAAYAWTELAWSRAVADGLAAGAKLRFDHYQQEPHVKTRPNGFNGSFPGGRVGIPIMKDRTVGGEVQLDWDPGARNHLIVGAAYELMDQYEVRNRANWDQRTGAYLGSFQEGQNWNKQVVRQLWAAYAQDEWQVLEQGWITAGVRWDHYDDFGDTVNPRVGLVYAFLDDAASLKLLYGRALRAPNLVELYAINNPAVVGNPDLRPETIQTGEAGVSYRPSRWFGLELDAFYSVIEALIVRDTGVPAGSPVVYVNRGEARTQGIEAGVSGAFGAWLAWRVNYAYQDPRDTRTGRHLPYVPSHRASVTLNGSPSRYVNLNVDAVWTGPRPREAGDPRAPSPPGAVLNLAVTGRALAPGLELQVVLQNLLDARRTDPDTSGARQLVPGDLPREGFSALGRATYRF